MKRASAMLLAALMCLSLGMAALAAPSQQAKPVQKGESSSTSSTSGSSSSSSHKKSETNGLVGGATGTSAINYTPASVTVDGKAQSVTGMRVLSDIPEIQRFKNRIAAEGLSFISPSLAGQTLIGLYEVTLDGYTGGQVTATFNVPGVRATDPVTVIHYLDYADKWEVIAPNSVGNGTVNVTLTSLSPVGFVVNRSAVTPAAGAQGVAPAAAAGVTSPKTGE